MAKLYRINGELIFDEPELTPDRALEKHKHNLHFANLRNGRWLQYTEFYDGNLYGADLSKANLSGAWFQRADLRYVNLMGANLTEADLSNADLRYADLNSANLTEADLNGADLRYADLNSIFKFTDLRNANLAFANLNRNHLKSSYL